ncbi:Amino acid permease 3, partial [Linum perenne]
LSLISIYIPSILPPFSPSHSPLSLSLPIFPLPSLGTLGLCILLFLPPPSSAESTIQGYNTPKTNNKMAAENGYLKTNTNNNTNGFPHHHQVLNLSIDNIPPSSSKWTDDDGRPKRTGTVWTASAHIITAVIGSGVLSLAWATAQLGWIAGPSVMFLFSFVTYYTSTLLASCYRSGHPLTGKRNYTYMDAVKSNLGGSMVKFCGSVQYVNLFGVAIGYTIASSISMMSIPDFDQLWWLSIVAAVMSFTYSTIGLGLGIAQVVANGHIMGSLTGITIGPSVTQTQKIWKSFQALGDIAFAYSYSIILIEIQVYCQPLFAFVEKQAVKRFPDSYFITTDIRIPLLPGRCYNLNLFRMVWRTVFVMLTTLISMLLPFFNGIVGLLGALGFWPLTVYLPVEMYIVQKNIPKWSMRWLCLQILSGACLIITIAAATGSIAGVLHDLKSAKPFHTTY